MLCARGRFWVIKQTLKYIHRYALLFCCRPIYECIQAAEEATLPVDNPVVEVADDIAYEPINMTSVL